jgi:hypothetical protein
MVAGDFLLFWVFPGFSSYFSLSFLMPISGPASYLPTMTLFLEHWEDVNGELGPSAPLLVGQPNPAGGSPMMKSRADLLALKDALVLARDAVTAETVGLALKRELVRDDMGVLLGRFNQFASVVRSRYAGKAHARSLPNAPSVGDGADVFAKAIKKAETLWLAINGTLGSSPLLLGAGSAGDPFYTVGNFTAALAVLRGKVEAAVGSEQSLRTLIEKRNDLQEVIAPLLRDYRQAVPGRFGGEHALVASLPRYSPPAGNKPAKAVVTSAMWDGAEGRAEVEFTPSTSGDVARHELRVCAGAEYDEDLEVIAGSLAVGEPPVFHTVSLLEAPGSVISVRVVAITGDDRESESNVMTIQRPPE